MWKFWFVLGGMWFLILLQGIAAYRDGFFTHRQMKSVHHIDKKHGDSFLDHGGMWSDIFIVSPLVAYIINKYVFAYDSRLSLGVLFIAFVLWTVLALVVYAPSGMKRPEAYTRNGRVTDAGWAHVLYVAVATWIITMAYAGAMTPTISNMDIGIISFVLSIWAYFGVMKFNSHWSFDKWARVQVLVEVIGLWVLAISHIW